MVRIDNGLQVTFCSPLAHVWSVRDGCIRSPSDNRSMSTLEMKESSRSPTIDTVNFTFNQDSPNSHQI